VIYCAERHPAAENVPFSDFPKETKQEAPMAIRFCLQNRREGRRPSPAAMPSISRNSKFSEKWKKIDFFGEKVYI
jgi:hypothetical protein